MKETPLHIDGIDNLYAGFGPRLASLLLDIVCVLPVVLITLYLNSVSKAMFFLTVVPNFIFGLWYNIYLPKKYGGTLGKLAVGISIIKIDGKPIGWKQAVLRHLVVLILTVFNLLLTVYAVMMADKETYESLSWLQQSQYLMAMAPVMFSIYTWTSNLWVWSEMIVLLTNPRKRAIHDYIAGTVIVKKIYIDRINREMYGTADDTELTETEPQLS